MPRKDPEQRRLADKKRYDAKRESILAQKRERQKDPEFQAQRKAYLRSEVVQARRRDKEKVRYATDASYRDGKVARAAARRAAPGGRERNADQAKAWREKYPGRAYAGVRRWLAANADYVRHYNRIYKQKRFAEDPGFKVAEYMRRRVRYAVNSQATIKDTTTMRLVGCTVATLVAHLEAQFKPGMSWQNYGKWHVDHIRELCSFDLTDPEQQAMAFHFTNLRPLWAEENLRRPGKAAKSKKSVLEHTTTPSST